ncbi:hypothetical protein OK074_0179 [Actinobacteria bacterium OK074]|nr:hypothetical protein OK074_0179 [Actinobacteria bacterium OK074]
MNAVYAPPRAPHAVPGAGTAGQNGGLHEEDTAGRRDALRACPAEALKPTVLRVAAP